MLIRPRPLPHARSTSNPTPSSAMVSVELVRGPSCNRDHLSRPAVLEGVLQRLLRDAEQA